MPWYKVSLTQNQVAWGNETRTLMDEFQKFLTSGEIPKTGAMYSRDSGDGGDILYFSPDSAKAMKPLLVQYGGVECEPLTGRGGLLIESRAGWDTRPQSERDVDKS